MVFLHPMILRDSREGTLRSNAKYNYIRQEQIAARQRGVGLLPNEKTPVLAVPEQVQKQGSFIDTMLDQPTPQTQPAETETTKKPSVHDDGGFSRR